MRTRLLTLATSIALLLATSAGLQAQGTSAAHLEHGGLDVETLKKANDPMADTKSFNVNNYFLSSLYGTEAKANQFLLRYAQPLGKFLMRATMPLVVSAPPNAGPVSGLGDFNVFAIYTLPTSTGNKFGNGPLLTAPTGTKGLGQGKWQAGAGIYLRSTGVWTFDLKSDNYNVPVGLGIGKVIKAGGVVFNIFAEPQFSVLAQGVGQARFQTFAGFNTQF